MPPYSVHEGRNFVRIVYSIIRDVVIGFFLELVELLSILIRIIFLFHYFNW